ERQVVAFEHLVNRQQAAVDRRDDLGLAPHDPPFGAGRGQVGDGQRLAERADYLGRTDFLVLDHYSLGSPPAARLSISPQMPPLPLPSTKSSRLMPRLPSQSAAM